MDLLELVKGWVARVWELCRNYEGGLGSWLEHGNLASNGRVVRGNVKLMKYKVKSHCSDLNACGGKVLYLSLVYIGGIVAS